MTPVMAGYSPLLNVSVNSLTYDFQRHKGRLLLPEDGLIPRATMILEMFLQIDPDVAQIWIFIGGRVSGSGHRERNGGWGWRDFDHRPTKREISEMARRARL